MSAGLAVITGAAGGIGAALARRLAGEGWQLHLVDRAEERLADLASALGDCASFAVSTLEDQAACARALPKGAISALIHMAGLFEPDDLDPKNRALYAQVMDANATSAYDICTAAESRLAKDGSIVLAASLAFNRGVNNYPAYAMSKGAVVGLMRSLSRRMAARGITVNAVAPGIIETPMTTDLIAARGLDQIHDDIPLGRLGQPEDVVGVIRFLISQDARFVTGQVINIDGGVVNG